MSARSAITAFCVVAGCSDPQPEAPPRKPPVTIAETPILADAAVDAAPALHPILVELAQRTASYLPADANVELVPFRDRDKWGYADRSLKIVIEPRYSEADVFIKGRAMVRVDGACGYIDGAGTEVVPIKFAACTRFWSGYAAAELKPDGWVIVDASGKPISKTLYEGVSTDVASDGLIAVIRDKKVGFLGADGAMRIDFQYSDFAPARDGLIPVAHDDARFGVIDTAGKPVLPFEYEDVQPFFRGLAIARKDGHTGVIDRAGTAVVPFEYEAIFGTGDEDHLVAQKTYGKPPTEIFDRQGKQTAKLPLVLTHTVAEGLAPFTRNKKYGFVDRAGKVVIPPRYEWAAGFSQGLAWVGNGGKHGFVDRTGKVVIPFKYAPPDEQAFIRLDEAGLARIRDAGRKPLFTDTTFYVDRTGKEYISRETRAWFASQREEPSPAPVPSP
jgi:hypothetical protein